MIKSDCTYLKKILLVNFCRSEPKPFNIASVICYIIIIHFTVTGIFSFSATYIARFSHRGQMRRVGRKT